MPNVWLRDVAKAAGVSVSAASHAINQTGNLAETTRQRILEVARELGYARNPTLSAIAARRFRPEARTSLFRCVPLQLIESEESRLSHWDRATLAKLEKAASGYGIQFDPFSAIHSVQALNSRISQAYAEGIEALLIVSSNRHAWLTQFDTSPFVVLGLEDLAIDFPYDRVEYDWGHAVMTCYEALRQRGCRRIGGAIHFADSWSYQDKVRVGAFLSEWMNDHGAKPAPLFPMLYEGEVSDEIVAWARKERLDGVVVWPLRYAYVLWNSSLCSAGDLQLAIFQVASLAEHLPVPGVQLSSDELTAAAVQMLYEQVTHHRQGKPQAPRALKIRGVLSTP